MPSPSRSVEEVPFGYVSRYGTQLGNRSAPRARTAQLDARSLATLLRVAGNDDTTSELEPYALLEEFRARMLDHFAAEEAEDFFGTITSEAPELSPVIDQLEDEHWALISAVSELQLLSLRPDQRRELVHGLSGLLARIEAHERAECSLLERFFFRAPPICPAS